MSLATVLAGHFRFEAAHTAARRYFTRVLKREGRASVGCVRPFLAKNYPEVDAEAVVRQLADDLRDNVRRRGRI